MTDSKYGIKKRPSSYEQDCLNCGAHFVMKATRDTGRFSVFHNLICRNEYMNYIDLDLSKYGKTKR